MRAAEEAVAKKFAQALLNLYYKDISQKCFSTLLELDAFLKSNLYLVRYLCIPTVPDTMKKDIVQKVFTALNVCDAVQRLISPLIKQRRIDLLELVIAQLITCYRERSNIIAFDVFTSHKMEEQDREDIVQFLTEQSGGTVVASFMIDVTLIAGFRAQSKTFLFEHSLMKKIRDAKTSFYQRIES